MYKQSALLLARVRGKNVTAAAAASTSASAAAVPLHGSEQEAAAKVKMNAADDLASNDSSGSGGGNLLEQIRKRLKQQQEEKLRRGLANTIDEKPTLGEAEQVTAKQNAADQSQRSQDEEEEASLVAHILNHTQMIGNTMRIQHAFLQKKEDGRSATSSSPASLPFASPFLAREAAKEEAQRKLGESYRQKKSVAAFDEIFPALGSGLMGGSNTVQKQVIEGGTRLDKRRYGELLAHLSPLTPSIDAIDRRGEGGGRGEVGGGKKQGASPSSSSALTIPQQRTAMVSALTSKIRIRWAALVQESFAALKHQNNDNSNSPAAAAAAVPSALQQEVALAHALERLVAELPDDELLVAAKTGLIDLEALSAAPSQIIKEGEGAEESGTQQQAGYGAKAQHTKMGKGDEDDDEAIAATVPPPTIAAAVLPTDIVEPLAHTSTLSEWLTDASAVVIGGQVTDDIAPLILRAQDPSKYGTFTEEEIRKLERYERELRRGTTGGGASSAKTSPLLPNAMNAKKEETEHVKQSETEGYSLSSFATNPLVGTNPLLHRLSTLSPAIKESIAVMDRTRISAMTDHAFQEGLAYTNALYNREYRRQLDKAEMKPLDSEEVSALQRNASRRVRVAPSRGQLDAEAAAAAEGTKRDDFGSIRNRQRGLRQRYGNGQKMSHAVDMAKAMRVLNPHAALRPETATDIPLFFNPNHSVPPPSAAMNLAMPSAKRKGKGMVRGGTKPALFGK